MCIRDFEEFVSLNTYFLSPSLLHEYLFGEPFKPEPEKTINHPIDEKFLFAIRECYKNNDIKHLENILEENDIWLDILIRLSGFSYELLGRLLLLLDEKSKSGEIIDDKLNTLINLCRKKRKRLPGDSQNIKKYFEDCKKLISFIISYASFGKLSQYLKKAIKKSNLWNYQLSEISLRFEQPIESLNKFLSTSDGQEKLILECLNRFYNLVSRGEQKAYEGYNYEDILVKYLRCHGIQAEGTTPENKKAKDSNNKDKCRNWDIYIPSKSQPKIVIECMYNVTTSSGQTNKCKAIVECLPKLKEKNISVLVLMDGAGWIARGSDTKKLLKEKDICVFTFNKNSLKGGINFISSLLNSHSR